MSTTEQIDDAVAITGGDVEDAAPSYADLTFLIKKNSYETLEVKPCRWNGHDLVAIWVLTERQSDGKLGPTKKGVVFKQRLLDEVLDALVKIRNGLGLTPLENENGPDDDRKGK